MSLSYNWQPVKSAPNTGAYDMDHVLLLWLSFVDMHCQMDGVLAHYGHPPVHATS